MAKIHQNLHPKRSLYSVLNESAHIGNILNPLKGLYALLYDIISCKRVQSRGDKSISSSQLQLLRIARVCSFPQLIQRPNQGFNIAKLIQK